MVKFLIYPSNISIPKMIESADITDKQKKLYLKHYDRLLYWFCDYPLLAIHRMNSPIMYNYDEISKNLGGSAWRGWQSVVVPIYS